MGTQHFIARASEMPWFQVDEDKEWGRIFQEVVLLISFGVAVQTGVAQGWIHYQMSKTKCRTTLLSKGGLYKIMNDRFVHQDVTNNQCRVSDNLHGDFQITPMLTGFPKKKECLELKKTLAVSAAP